MEYTATSGNPEKQRTDCLVLGVFESGQLSASAEQLDRASEGLVVRLVKRGDITGKPGQTLLLPEVTGLSCERLLLVGCGAADKLDDKGYARVVNAVVGVLKGTAAKNATLYLPELPVKDRDVQWLSRYAVQLIEAALYRFDELKSKAEEATAPALAKIILGVSGRKEQNAAEAGIKEGQAIGAGVGFARDLGNRPGNICTPSYLAEQAKALGKEYSKLLKVKVLDEKEMSKLGMGALLAVARGSEQPPQFIIMEYKNAPDKKQKPVVLVGKGVTFDSGGISIKPSSAMDEMKYDMGGAASVFGTFRTLVELALPLNVVGLIPTVENMPDGRATKPGDIVTSLSGQTVEILNTDAEGRLILCEALTYSERFEPEVVVDMATLTGACMVALGRVVHGLFSPDPQLAQELLAAGTTAADRAWELPVWEDYQEGLDSNFADMANVGDRYGGAITAACFLARFARKLSWAHLDIAGTAWTSGKNKGATGRPVPMLTQFLLNRVKG